MVYVSKIKRNYFSTSYDSLPDIGTVIVFTKKGAEFSYKLVGYENFITKSNDTIKILRWRAKCVRCNAAIHVRCTLRGKLRRYCDKHAIEARNHFMAVLRGKKKAKAIREGRYRKPVVKKVMPYKPGYVWDKYLKRYMRFLVKPVKSVDELL